MVTKEEIKSEIEKVPDERLPELYQIVKGSPMLSRIPQG